MGPVEQNPVDRAEHMGALCSLDRLRSENERLSRYEHAIREWMAGRLDDQLLREVAEQLIETDDDSK